MGRPRIRDAIGIVGLAGGVARMADQSGGQPSGSHGSLSAACRGSQTVSRIIRRTSRNDVDSIKSASPESRTVPTGQAFDMMQVLTTPSGAMQRRPFQHDPHKACNPVSPRVTSAPRPIPRARSTETRRTPRSRINANVGSIRSAFASIAMTPTRTSNPASTNFLTLAIVLPCEPRRRVTVSWTAASSA